MWIFLFEKGVWDLIVYFKIKRDGKLGNYKKKLNYLWLRLVV